MQYLITHNERNTAETQTWEHKKIIYLLCENNTRGKITVIRAGKKLQIVQNILFRGRTSFKICSWYKASWKPKQAGIIDIIFSIWKEKHIWKFASAAAKTCNALSGTRRLWMHVQIYIWKWSALTKQNLEIRRN